MAKGFRRWVLLTSRWRQPEIPESWGGLPKPPEGAGGRPDGQRLVRRWVHPARDSLRSPRTGKGSPSLLKAPEGARLAKGLSDRGRTWRPAGDNLRSPGSATGSRSAPDFSLHTLKDR